MDIYVAKKDVDIATLVLQPEEVVDAKWVSHEELLKMIEVSRLYGPLDSDMGSIVSCCFNYGG